jgi:hypothetical protein
MSGTRVMALTNESQGQTGPADGVIVRGYAPRQTPHK